MADLSTRPYHSPRRQQAALETRRLVVEAARQQFVRHGYVAASLAAIAQSAGVSLATVKLVAGTKAQLLVVALQALTRDDTSATPLADQSSWQQVLADRDPEAVVRQFASVARSALERQADLFEVLWQAAASDPNLAELERHGSLERWRTMREVAQALADLGGLRPDLAVDVAADNIWVLAAPQVYRLLVGRRGWSATAWETWLADSLMRQLLVPRRTRQRTQRALGNPPSQRGRARRTDAD